MFPAARRFAAQCGLITCLATADSLPVRGASAEPSFAPLAVNAVSPVRAAPSRPGTGVEPASPAPAGGLKAPPPLAITRFKNVDYVATTDFAARLGLKGKWEEAKRQLTLTTGPRRLVLTGQPVTSSPS